MGFKGTRVISIPAGGWAERSGILEHDLIVEVDGEDFKALNTRERVEVEVWTGMGCRRTPHIAYHHQAAVGHHT